MWHKYWKALYWLRLASKSTPSYDRPKLDHVSILKRIKVHHNDKHPFKANNQEIKRVMYKFNG